MIFVFAAAQVAFASTLPQLLDLTPQTAHVASEFSQDVDAAEDIESAQNDIDGIFDPEALSGSLDAIQIAVSSDFAIALQADGTLWSWGNNDFGQLGLDDTDPRLVPTLIPDAGVSGDEWISVSAGANHVLALRDNGQLYAWGTNANGRLGIGIVGGVQLSPIAVASPVSGETWAEISAGDAHSLAILSDGTLWAWGNNLNGRLGFGTAGGNFAAPTEVTAPVSGSEWTAISVGTSHTLALRDNGQLYAWGTNANGRLGIGVAGNNFPSPTAVTSPVSGETWTEISAGDAHSLAILSDGTLWAWGINSNGRLGVGGVVQRLAPAIVLTTGVSGSEWIAVSAGATHTIALRDSGELYVWGNNAVGQLGLGDVIQRLTPAVVPATNVSGDEWIVLSYGDTASHVIVMRDDGTLWSWGDNTYGQLGKGIAGAGQGTGTDNWIPWRIAASLQSDSASDWAVADDATAPYNGEVDVSITTDTLTVRFDRPMRTEAEFRGDIVIDNGATVNVAAGTWSENNTVFTMPLTLVVDETLHTVTISGFVCDFSSRSKLNEMYPHTWTFTTGEELPFVEGDPIAYDSSTCATCHFVDNLKLEHQFVSSRGLTAASNNYDYGCQACHGQEFPSVTDKIDWNSHAPLMIDMLDDAEITEDGCMACHGGPDNLVHGGPGNMLNTHFVNAAVDTGCSASGCHGPRSADEPTGFGFGAMDLASAHADYWLAVQDGRILSGNVSSFMGDDNPFACGICHARDYNGESRLRPQIITHLETTGGTITCAACHIPPDTNTPNWEILHLAQREMQPGIVQALDLTASINNLTAADFLGSLSAQTRAELNVGAPPGDRLEPGVLGSQETTPTVGADPYGTTCCEPLAASVEPRSSACICINACGVICDSCICPGGWYCQCQDHWPDMECCANCPPPPWTPQTPRPPSGQPSTPTSPTVPTPCPCLTGGTCDCGDDCNCDPARCACTADPYADADATDREAAGTGPATGEESNWYLHIVIGSALIAALIVVALTKMPRAGQEE